jgi:hypothetical protein
MGILSALLGDANPAAVWAAQNRGWLGQVGAGFGSGTSFSDGLAQAASMGPQGQRVDDAYRVAEEQKAERQRAINQTSEYLRNTFPDLAEAVNAGMPMDAAWNEAMKRKQPGYGQQAQADLPASIQEYNFAKEQGFTGSFMDFQTQRGGAAEVSLTPTWGIDADPNSPTYNKPVLGQLNKAGRFVKTELPEGVQPMDPGQLAGVRTEATVDAKAAGAARQALPAAEAAYEMTTKAVEALLSDEKGQSEQFSQNPLLPRNMFVMGGSPMANMQNQMKQLTGQAFLQIRQALKGAGQVTDYEGQRGEAAISRAQAAFESGDQKAFQQAVIEFKDAMDKGMQLLRAQANGGYAAGSPAVTGASNAGGGWKVVGVR